MTVPAGELVSAPVTLSVSDWSFAADMHDKAEYSIAVSLAQTPGVELGRQNLLTLDITKNAYLNLKAEAPANPKQIDRTNWVCSKMDGIEGDANVLKGTAGGDVASNSAPWWVMVDMAATHTLIGAKTTHWAWPSLPRRLRWRPRPTGRTGRATVCLTSGAERRTGASSSP